MILADTDVLIDALRGKEPSVGRIALELKTGSLATTTITAFELLSGAKTAQEQDKVQKLLAALRIIPFDSEAASKAARARLKLEAEGNTIGMADYLIAGICLSRKAVLLTRNIKHFDKISGIKIGALALPVG